MYKHLNQEVRDQIQSLLRAQHTTAEIARLFGRQSSTIGREIKRGCGLKGYRAEQACRKASLRSSHRRNVKQKSPQPCGSVLSPISAATGALSKLPGSCHQPRDDGLPAHLRDKAQGGCLQKHRKSQKPRRKWLGAGQDPRGQISMRVPIAQRPASVNSRKHIGHCEGNTVVGAGHKQAIVTLVERKICVALLVKVPVKRPDLVAQAID